MFSIIVGIVTGFAMVVSLFVNIIKTVDSKHEKFLEELGWGKVLIGFGILFLIFKMIVEPPLAAYLTTLFLIKVNLMVACVIFVINKASISFCTRVVENKEID